MASTRIGILGGTFDPPHLGHAALASCALAGGAVDEVRVIVAGEPWQKAARNDMASAADRLAMTRLAFAEQPGITIDTREIERDGPTYTYDTARSLRSEHPSAELMLVVGSDVAVNLDSWHRAADVAELVTVGVVRRPGVEWSTPSPMWHLVEIDGDPPAVSSTEIRRRCRTGEPVSELMSPAVCQLIADAGLYGFQR